MKDEKRRYKITPSNRGDDSSKRRQTPETISKDQIKTKSKHSIEKNLHNIFFQKHRKDDPVVIEDDEAVQILSSKVNSRRKRTDEESEEDHDSNPRAKSKKK